jgi:PTS system mannose-specific IIA component
LEGDVTDVEAISLGWGVPTSEATGGIEEAVHRLRDRCGSVMILTDMFGGAPTDVALSLLEPGVVEVATGVNLPMVMKFHQFRRQTDFSGVVRKIAEQGRSSIQVAGDLLRKPSADSEA